MVCKGPFWGFRASLWTADGVALSEQAFKESIPVPLGCHHQTHEAQQRQNNKRNVHMHRVARACFVFLYVSVLGFRVFAPAVLRDT